MSTSPITAITGSLVQHLVSQAPQVNGPITPAIVNASSFVPQEDSSRLSPFAQLLGKVQQLQHTDPDQHQAVTQQAAADFHTAAQAAEEDGNAVLAKQLEQLFVEFTKLAKAGRLPDEQNPSPFDVLAKTLAEVSLAGDIPSPIRSNYLPDRR